METMQTSPNAGIINNPLADVIQGIVQGAQLHAQLQHQQDLHTAMQRAEMESQREARLKDIQTQMDLDTKGRRIENGVVMEPGISQNIAGIDASLPGYARKPDAKRRVTYKNADGQSMDWELYTPEEQTKRALERMSQTAQAQGNAVPITEALSRQTGLPVGSFVHPTTIPGLLNAATQDMEIDTPEDIQNEFGVGPRITNRQLAPLTAALGRRQNSQAANERLGKPRVTKIITDNDGNATEVYSDGSTKDLGKIGAKKIAKAGGATPKPNAQKERQQQNDQKEVDRLQQEEQKLHGLRSALGDAMKASDDDTVPNPLAPSSKVKVNAAYRALWKNKIDEAAKKITGLQQTQQRLISKWGGQVPQQPDAKVLDANVALEYLKKAGGDKAKAREMAQRDGYTIPQASPTPDSVQ
jgi:hypothetical protein